MTELQLAAQKLVFFFPELSEYNVMYYSVDNSLGFDTGIETTTLLSKFNSIGNNPIETVGRDEYDESSYGITFGGSDFYLCSDANHVAFNLTVQEFINGTY